MLQRDHRSLINAIKAGNMRGGAIPHPQRLRWYVYADELTNEARPAAAAAADTHGQDLRAENDELRAQNTVLRNVRIQNVSLTEANRILIATQQNLLDADQATVDKYRDLARSYLDALAQFMTPGDVGELAGDLGTDL